MNCNDIGKFYTAKDTDKLYSILRKYDYHKDNNSKKYELIDVLEGYSIKYIFKDCDTHVMFIFDHVTDKDILDMFVLLPDAFSAKVGDRYIDINNNEYIACTRVNHLKSNYFFNTSTFELISEYDFENMLYNGTVTKKELD